jgi:hypothetical protein
MNSIKRNILQEFKQCAGRGCERKAETALEIRYLHKKAYFCDSCAADLLRLGLAEADTSIDKISCVIS